MGFDQIKELLEKIPAMLLLMCYLGYLGFDYYIFASDSNSPLLVKQKTLDNSKELYSKLETKLRELNEFVKSLDVKKDGLRKYALELQDLKGSLPEVFDVSRFMEMTLTEAAKSGMRVQSLIPADSLDKEYYSEHRFKLICSGIFPQISTFLDRMSKATEIVRVDSFRLSPIPDKVGGTYTELNAELELKTYQYLGSKADTVVKNDAVVDGSDSNPASSKDDASRAKGGKQ